MSVDVARTRRLLGGVGCGLFVAAVGIATARNFYHLNPPSGVCEKYGVCQGVEDCSLDGTCDSNATGTGFGVNAYVQGNVYCDCDTYAATYAGYSNTGFVSKLIADAGAYVAIGSAEVLEHSDAFCTCDQGCSSEAFLSVDCRNQD
jgi:hypothetical protein